MKLWVSSWLRSDLQLTRGFAVQKIYHNPHPQWPQPQENEEGRGQHHWKWYLQARNRNNYINTYIPLIKGMSRKTLRHPSLVGEKVRSSRRDFRLECFPMLVGPTSGLTQVSRLDLYDLWSKSGQLLTIYLFIRWGPFWKALLRSWKICSLRRPRLKRR